MKRLLIALFLLHTIGTFSQTIHFTTGYLVNPAVSCHSGMMVCTQTGSNPESGGIIYVDWADGTTDTLTYYQAANTSNQCHFFWHDYTSTGIYNANITIYSAASGGMVPVTTTQQFTITNLSTCGYFTMATFDTPSYFLESGVVYDVTGANGVTLTISPVLSTGLSFYFGLDPANAPFTASINDSWLAVNNKIQVTPDFVINDFNADGSAYNLPQNMQVTCNDTTLPNNLALDFIYAYSFIAPLQSGSLSLNICNISCASMVDAQVSISFPSGFTPDMTNLDNAIFQNDTLLFDLDSITGCQNIHIPVSFPGNTPAGTNVSFHAQISNPTEVDFSNNSGTANAVIMNSYDPNDKTCNLPALLSPDQREKLQYRIQCQNDGNFPALNVVIRDTISQLLDLNTFRFISSSHPVITSIDPVSREVIFYLYNAQLVSSSENLPASQGFVLYEISEAVSLPLNAPIENTAYIYFDYNPPIVTNTTSHSNGYLGLDEQSQQAYQLYPNPANDRVFLMNGLIADIKVYDLNGKLLTQGFQVNSVSVATLNAGLYQVVVHSGNHVSFHRVIKL
ncbi:T9SS type A sorting domain-containing protein [Fluviicola sp.]|jgi:uncharacterized repeat protein (TIGR01451 family)|uniref:T9SS type A sorting domain-containing protein n=1 Tax=Fluviicola sp. TaxID=1917219 RepID=UPI00282159C4|nr:T9SS type A sorting domain-containing protein [Fluviicola sp.]MDR0801307.1 T9SS type A sorting domain-containing protein [Fluviicola sp.]